MKIKSSAIAAVALGVLLGPSASAKPLRIVTTFYPVYVAALNVTDGIAGVEVHNMAGPHAGCLHDYQLTTSDARKLSEADLLLANGAGMETFLEKIRAQNPGLEIVDTSKGIRLLDGNAHVWVGPESAARQVDNIAAALSRADPDRASLYAANAAGYNAKLGDMARRMKSALAPFAGRTVVTLHDTFPYFAREFGFDIAGVIEDEPGHEPGARQLAAMVDLVRDGKIGLILTEPQYTDKAAQAVARETGAKVCRIDPVATGPVEPEQARGAYLRAMAANSEALQRALH